MYDSQSFPDVLIYCHGSYAVILWKEFHLQMKMEDKNIYPKRK